MKRASINKLREEYIREIVESKLLQKCATILTMKGSIAKKQISKGAGELDYVYNYKDITIHGIRTSIVNSNLDSGEYCVKVSDCDVFVAKRVVLPQKEIQYPHLEVEVVIPGVTFPYKYEVSLYDPHPGRWLNVVDRLFEETQEEVPSEELLGIKRCFPSIL